MKRKINAMFVLSGLQNWTWRWASSGELGYGQAGECRHDRNEIIFKRHQINPEIIAHEIAHALTSGHGHDATWWHKAAELDRLFSAVKGS